MLFLVSVGFGLVLVILLLAVVLFALEIWEQIRTMIMKRSDN